MRILGLSAYYHDSAAALIENSLIVAAAQEERFTRKKHDSSYPRHALEFCLNKAGCNIDDIDYIAFYDKPFLKFERLLETYVGFAPKGFNSFRMAIPVWVKEKLFQKNLLIEELRANNHDFDWDNRLLFAEHHFSHAASAFYPSPFREAVVLTIDGVGEWSTTSVAIGNDKNLKIEKELHFPHSLGLLYSAFTYYIGFKVNSGEYKLMGLAPYGDPTYYSLVLDRLLDLKPDGTFRLNMKYFNYATGLTMTNARFESLFGRDVRNPEDPIEKFHMDIAASIQAVLEEIILRLTRSLAKEYHIANLCLAGGVALNCVANGKILRDGAFKNIWIQPAAGDAGGSLGAAFAAYHGYAGKERHIDQSRLDKMQGAYLGPTFEQEEIEQSLTDIGAVYQVLKDDELLSATAETINDGNAVAWFQGAMEFGPRALGNRSILGDPRSPDMQKLLNLKVKFRESFRPFAPSVLREHVSDWFEIGEDSPYMLYTAEVKENRKRRMSDEEKDLFGIDQLNIVRSQIPAVTHVDYSARIQTVHADTNPRFYALINRFYELTGCPVLINTSFNVRGEPIVCTPDDAFNCFMGTGIERLVIGNCFLKKEDQDTTLAHNYKTSFDPD